MIIESITKEDVEILKEVLECWNGLSAIDSVEQGYEMQTDHLHNTFNAAESLLEKMKRMANATLDEK
jgi:hypothetical protein